MTFQAAVRSGFTNYTNFEGRASRPEYWYWFLFNILAYVAVGFVSELLGISSDTLAGLLSLALLLPSVAVGIRRLHDTGRSGWHLLWALIPFGGLWVLFLMAQRGQPGPNRYGPEPRVAAVEV